MKDVKVTKNEDHYLIQNAKGEYHLSIDEFEKLGAEKAIEFAESQIEKKLKSTSIDQDEKLTLESAHEKYGFCKYGIKEFAEKCGLDHKSAYTSKEIYAALTQDAFLAYPNETLKLFGDSTFEKFGGARSFLSQFLADDADTGQAQKARNAVLNSDLLTIEQKHLLACDFAENVLDIFEEKYPDDKRPREAIWAKREWVKHGMQD